MWRCCNCEKQSKCEIYESPDGVCGDGNWPTPAEKALKVHRAIHESHNIGKLTGLKIDLSREVFLSRACGLFSSEDGSSNVTGEDIRTFANNWMNRPKLPNDLVNWMRRARRYGWVEPDTQLNEAQAYTTHHKWLSDTAEWLISYTGVEDR